MSPRLSCSAALLLAAIALTAAGASVKDIYPHDHSAEGRFMRKEGAVGAAAAATQEPAQDVPASPIAPKAWVSPPQQPQAQATAAVASAAKQATAAASQDEPAGYVSRGQDCIGDQAIAPMYLHNAPLVACANHCNKLSGCKGFTYKKSSKACFFKGFTCKKTTETGMEFYQKETCKYDADACHAAISQSGFQAAQDFAVEVEGASGCLSYKEGPKKGLAFYGLGKGGAELRIKEEVTEKEDLPHYLQRVPGFGCPTDTDASPGVVLTQMEQLGGEIVLEDELERVAALSPTDLAREVAENQGELRPVQIELLAPGQQPPTTDSARLRRPLGAASATEEKEKNEQEEQEEEEQEMEAEEEEDEEDEQGLEHDSEEDEEDEAPSQRGLPESLSSAS
eukprot:CAMPEP_0206598162 /NCGR_PEP_ID=MMETSP0325_2-20121206/44498_1 /ASSEMBLY_ACC=CAM_ASM_000347 /TAXON_ID=2866 /ORGANISM="Crypthecodinium cohnii, Strain Seligo" /LENGTH=394 /DNA_ID=CAMNT_0054109147 /DNA_START=52 /DNA_END=1234 /DNA_ORIENTATION=+